MACFSPKNYSNVPIAIVFAALFIGNLQLSVVIPILPDVIETGNLSSNHVPLIVGTVIGTGYLTEVLCMPFVICLLATVGQAWTLTFSSLSEALGCLIIGSMQRIPALYVGRILQCSGAVFMDISASSLVAHYYQRSKRNRAFASVYNALPLSYVTSYFFGTLLYEQLGYQVLLTAISVLTALVIPLWFCLPKVADDLEPLEPLQPSTRPQGRNVLVLALCSNLLVWAAYSLMDSTLPYDFHARFHAEASQVGLIMAVSVLAQITAQVIVGECAATLSWRWTGVIVVSAVGLAIYPLLPSLWYAVLTQCLVRIAHGAVNTATGCIVAEWVDARTEPSEQESRYSKLYGLHSLSKVIGLASGALVGGIVFDLIGIRILYWGAGSIIGVCGVVIAIAAYLIHHQTHDATIL